MINTDLNLYAVLQDRAGYCSKVSEGSGVGAKFFIPTRSKGFFLAFEKNPWRSLLLGSFNDTILVNDLPFPAPGKFAAG